MSDLIYLRKAEYQTKINNLREAVGDLEYKLAKGESFSKTDIDPFVKDLEHFIRTLELIDEYQAMLLEDIGSFEKIGEGLENQDNALSKLNNGFISKNIPSEV